jgi:tetratricopeptide (TPR) repeat protein
VAVAPDKEADTLELRPRRCLALVSVLAGLSSPASAQQLPCLSGQDAIQRRAFSTALSHLTRCLEIKGLPDRDVSAALQMRAIAHSQMGSPLRAVEDYRRSLELLPPSMAWDLLPLAIYLREAGTHAESLEVLQRVLTLDEDGPGSGPGGAVFFHLGWTLHELRRFVEAIDAYRKGIAKQPRFEGLYARRAIAHDALGDADRARADLVRAIAISTAKGIDPADAPEEYRKKFLEYGLIK